MSALLCEQRAQVASGDATSVVHVTVIEELGGRLIARPAAPSITVGRCEARDVDQQVLSIQTLLEGEMLELVLSRRFVRLLRKRRRER